ncbi:hypothetical protein [Hungatella hathewayi]|uniref:hypothetical protein n=1 Tax=Hungatella hathewayi TaxID=154046 RepID=UPI002A7F46D4|nr:hypothetical protein [Hungatella hathewayi]
MTGKKNEFVFTIGFKRTDPEHVRVVNILNETASKNPFIVDAVLCYVDSGYMNVRPWNIQPAFGSERLSSSYETGLIARMEERPDAEDNLDTEDIHGIFQSLSAFRRDNEV